MANNNGSGKSLKSWIWDAACSIRGAKDAPKYKDYILPLVFTKRLGLEDVKPDYDNDELDRFPAEAGFPGKSSADWGWVQHMSPSRYIHTGDAETYRPIAEIVEELNAVELAARETDEALRGILKQLGFGA